MVVPRKHRTTTANSHPCGICKVQPFKYICPRCNLRYCSLTCYKDQSHIQCTESFYKSAVMSELESRPKATSQDRQKMLGILDRFEKQAVDQEHIFSDSTPHLLGASSSEASAIPAHSPGTNTAKTQGPSRRALTAHERDELIRKAILQEQSGVSANTEGVAHVEGEVDEEDEEMERVLDQEYEDFVKRFQGVDLEQESFETIWARLSLEEQQEFREKFMISGQAEDGGSGEGLDMDLEEDYPTGESEDEDGEERQERRAAKELLKEMGETLERGGGEKVGKKNHGKVPGGSLTGLDETNPMTVDLDAADLRVIRDAEISELIPIWRPWWEIEAEESGQLKKVVVSEVTQDEEQRRKEESQRLHAGSIVHDEGGKGSLDNTIPKSASGTTVTEQFVLDEEAMLRPHQGLVQAIGGNTAGEQEGSSSTALPMIKEPHPSLIYHVCALIFAYAATIRVLNGDIMEEPEQTLFYIFDLCPFFTPPPSTSTSSKKGLGATGRLSAVLPQTQAQLPEVEDFETTLAVLQQASLVSKLWKGDTLRLEMLSLLLRDVTLVLARPSRCLRCLHDLQKVFEKASPPAPSASVLVPASTLTSSPQHPPPRQRKRGGLFSKSVLHRLIKKLEFYESFIQSVASKSNRLDHVRTEAVLAGIRVRQEMVGWSKELESVKRVVVGGDAAESSSASEVKKVLIEELS